MPHIINIKCDNAWRSRIKIFLAKSKETVEKLKWFICPSNSKFSSIPDPIDPAGLIFEIKTRTLNSEGPLKCLEKFLSYFAQTNGRQNLNLGIYSCFKKTMYCVDVKMGVRNVVCNDQIFDLWCHTEIKELRIFGEKIAGKPITYENLKALRGYTRICRKQLD